MGLDESVREVFRRQHGVISREQATKLGVTDSQIWELRKSGEWLSLASGVYSLSTAPRTWKRQLAAALLHSPGTVVGGSSAATLLGFEQFAPSKPQLLAPFEGNARSQLARIIRSRHFELVSTTNRGGFECTTPAETILTLSLKMPPAFIERVIDRELARNALQVEAFDPILDRLSFARQPGLKPLRRIIAGRRDNAYQPPTSELEVLLFRLLEHPDLPAHSRQLPIRYPQATATVDSYIDDWKMIVEADGRRWHTTKQHFETDRKRDNAALAAGLVVVRFTWKMLRYEPSACLKTLVSAGSHRTSP